MAITIPMVPEASNKGNGEKKSNDWRKFDWMLLSWRLLDYVGEKLY